MCYGKLYVHLLTQLTREITRKGVPFYWGEEQQKAFDSIKEDVTNAPVLLMPNTTGHFVLVSDTSKIGCGAALYQKQKSKYHLIAYYSKKLPEAVERYRISGLELTGVNGKCCSIQTSVKKCKLSCLL